MTIDQEPTQANSSPDLLNQSDIQPYSNAEALPEQPVFEPICLSTLNPDLVLSCRQLTARYYLKREFVGEDEVNEEGVIDDDPYVDQSLYYALLDGGSGELIAGTRKIYNKDGLSSFPIMKHGEKLYADAVSHLESMDPDNIVEVSALVKEPKLDHDNMATLRLYRKLYQDAYTSLSGDGRQEQVFIMACNPQLFRDFKTFFDGVITRIGPDLQYPGQIAVPAMLQVDTAIEVLAASANDPENSNAEIQSMTLRYCLEGLDPDIIDKKSKDALIENGFEDILIKLQEEKDGKIDQQQEIDAIERSLVDRLKHRKPEVVFGLGLLAYTAARTVGVAYGISPHTNVDWRIFLGIEVATTAPYVWGMGDLTRSIIRPEDYTRGKKMRAALFASTCLLAPYVYVGAEGQGMPKAAVGGVAAVLVLSVASVGRKLYGKVKERRNLSAASYLEE